MRLDSGFTTFARGARSALRLQLRTFLAAAALFGATVAPASAEEETEAVSCIRTRVWDGYSDGWGVRTMTDTKLKVGETRNYLVTLYFGNTYKVLGCGATGTTNLDILIYDARGNVVMRDKADGREPVIEYTPQSTASYYVVLYLRGLAPEQKEADVAMAVVYK